MNTTCPACGWEAILDDANNLRCGHKRCSRYGELVDPNGTGARTKATAGD